MDDCSTDSTVEIVKRLQSENLGKIHLHEKGENMGAIQSAKVALKYWYADHSKYASFLDGDDYWCYEGKLQAQIDFLEANPEYAGCFHDAEIHQMNVSGNVDYMMKTQNRWHRYSQFNRYEPEFMPISLVERNIIPTSSLIYRVTLPIVKYVENYNLDLYSFSWAVELEIIKNSKFRYFNECWSIYNDHPWGISKRIKLSDFKLNNIRILEALLSDEWYSYFAPEIYKTICSEFRMMLKSNETMELKKCEYRKLIRDYKKYLRLLCKSDIKQLKHDYNVRNSRAME
jgi:glycosyltransferase involved in cell wall biosynthesis